MTHLASLSRRTLLAGAPGLALAGCFDRPYYERVPEQKKFLEDLARIAKEALSSNNPLQMEHAVERCLRLAIDANPLKGWHAILRKVEGTSQDVTITLEIGPQVTLFSFNDALLKQAERFRQMLLGAGKKPEGLSRDAVAALKTFRLNDQVQFTGRVGDFAGSGLTFAEMKGWFGRSETDYRTFLQAPRFVASIESLAPPPKKS